MTLKVYLAGRFSRRDELRELAESMANEYDMESTARWLNGSHGAPGDETSYSESQLSAFAAEDLADIRTADAFVLFTEHPDVGYTSGGRLVEYGYALAHHKNIVIVGPKENVFCQGQMAYRDFDDAISYLSYFVAPPATGAAAS